MLGFVAGGCENGGATLAMAGTECMEGLLECQRTHPSPECHRRLRKRESSARSQESFQAGAGKFPGRGWVFAHEP